MQRIRVWLTKWEKIQVLKILRWPIVYASPTFLETLIVCPRQSIFCVKSYFEFFLVNSFPSKNGSFLNNFSARYTTERSSTWAYWKFSQMSRASDFSELFPTVYFFYTNCRGSDLTFTTPTIKRPLTSKMRLIYIRLTNQIRVKSVRSSGSVVEAISEPL